MTDLLSRLGMSVPIVIAPMGRVVGPDLCAAVSNAGGFGIMPFWYAQPDDARAAIRAAKDRTNQGFGVNLRMTGPVGAPSREALLEVCIAEGIKAVSLFWGVSEPMIRRARDGGLVVMQTVGSAAEARIAVDAGADVIVAQGWEAGGHVWGTVATMALVPAVVDAVGPVPVIAAGGIADGRGLAAAMALGASAGWMGTRFLGSSEARIHQRYRDLLFAATESDTYYGDAVFNGSWENAPHRALRNKTVIAWEEAGRPATGSRPGEGEVIATSPSRGDTVRYQSHLAAADVTGDIDALSLWAGQGVALVHREQPAAEIVAEVWAEAQSTIARLQRGASTP